MGGRSGGPSRRPGLYSHLTDQLLPEGGAPPVGLLPRNVHAGFSGPTTRAPLACRRLNRSARPKPGSRRRRLRHAGSGAGIVGNGVVRGVLWEMEFAGVSLGLLVVSRVPQPRAPLPERCCAGRGPHMSGAGGGGDGGGCGCGGFLVLPAEGLRRASCCSSRPYCVVATPSPGDPHLSGMPPRAASYLRRMLWRDCLSNIYKQLRCARYCANMI